MKPITPAYSVIAVMMILALTLAATAASVFAQVNTSATEASPEEVVGEESNIQAMAVAAKSPYKIEKLMSDRVFSDFVVGPGRFQLEIAPGESKTVEIIVTNRMGIPKTFRLTAEDMSGNSDPDKTMVLLGDEVGPYSIKDFISVPEDTFVLQHSERASIPVTVSIPADAEPGGFYGSLLTQIVSEDVAQGAAEGAVPGSKIVSRIGTLFFVTTPGDIERSLEVKEFSTLEAKRFFTKGPIEFHVVTENTGSVHVTPYAQMRIYNTIGNEVGFVELEPWYVLPYSIRNKEVEWNRELLVGRYTAVIDVNRGYDNIVDTFSFTFWVVPLELVAGVFAVLFVFFLILRFLSSRFEFRRKDR